MSAEETASRSLLDKPLHQLTEDDISQVTREDCRRYLKDKGMRRPSWNKSQAIQQVISLKTLLETTPDSDANAEARKKLCTPRLDSSPRVDTTTDTRISVPADESIPYPRQDPPRVDFSGDIPRRAATGGDDSVSSRTKGTAHGTVGQMTIFYCGKVNVYDDVPGCKAQAILQLAASSFSFPQEDPADRNTTQWSLPCRLQAAGLKVGPVSPLVIFPTVQTVKVADSCQLPRVDSSVSHDDSLESPASRKASVQRYLEKRKDRFKNKRKLAMPSSTSLDIYVSHQVGDQFANEQLNQSEPCSSPQAGPPHTLPQLSSIEIIPNIASLYAGPDAKDAQA